MDLNEFCRKLPKIELHAHLNGSLSSSTMLQLKRYYVDAGIPDNTNVFYSEFQIGAGDTRNLSDCFQVFSIAHSLTKTPEALAMASKLTLKEFQDDGCCYIELRSTPRETSHMTRKQYIETLIKSIRESNQKLDIIARLIVSIDRRSSIDVANEIAQLAVKYHKLYPDIVVGIEISGDPVCGKFSDFENVLDQARNEGLKVTLHCAEVCNPGEILEMLEFKPDRLGHGTCIHPRLGGTADTWSLLCQLRIPIEVCMTSNVNTKSTPDYESHHFKELYKAKIPLIICTDDKGVFATSLSQEYKICAETFGLKFSDMAKISLDACQHVFSDDAVKDTLRNKIQSFMSTYVI